MDQLLHLPTIFVFHACSTLISSLLVGTLWRRRRDSVLLGILTFAATVGFVEDARTGDKRPGSVRNDDVPGFMCGGLSLRRRIAPELMLGHGGFAQEFEGRAAVLIGGLHRATPCTGSAASA